MASRAELKICCKELEIDSDGMNIEEMKEVIKEEADKKFVRKSKVSMKYLSETLLKFLTEEYHYVIRNKNGDEINYKEVT